MENLTPLEAGTYIIAVSGGVDSVVLLDMLRLQKNLTLIVAHFDHGIRSNSRDDEQFVAGLAARYQLAYASERQELGKTASEETAREARYDFLYRVKNKHNARSIITAHHGNDVVETMIINVIRGTGWRGLCSLKNTPDLCRPLLSFSKAQIAAYAERQHLVWKEDSTNADEKHLRNAVRRRLTPLLNCDSWLELYEKQVWLAAQVDKEVSKLQSLKRYDYIMWPPSVGLEMIRQHLGLTRAQAMRALVAVKTARAGDVATIGDGKKLVFTRDTFIVEPLKA